MTLRIGSLLVQNNDLFCKAILECHNPKHNANRHERQALPKVLYCAGDEAATSIRLTAGFLAANPLVHGRV